MKVKMKNKDGVTQVKILAKHIMETGLRKDKSGKVIPAHHITNLTATYKGNEIFVASLGPAISRDPYVSFSFKGAAKGDSVDFNWRDNQGKTAQKTAKIK